jgi:2-haloacid dehalogenase
MPTGPCLTFSVTALCEQLYPGKGNQLAQIWRVKQLQYSLMRSLMGRHRDFWGLTEGRGEKLAILSNGEPKMLEAAARSAGIRELLDEVISVEEVKICKVSPRVYNLGPERMKVTNPELGFISANSWDINGAASAGLNTFWIQRSTGEVPEELGFEAGAVVKAITELAPLLRG